MRPAGLARTLLTAALAAALAVRAVDGLAQARAPEPATEPPPANVTGADLMESMRSEVRIIARENHEVEEYRVGNNVYMIKVKPKNAPPYYLYDEDGSGNFQWRRGMDLERTQVPHWAIMRW